MAGLHFAFTADNGNFMRALHEVTAGVRDASRQIEADGGSIDRTISRIKTGLATLGVGLGFKEITSAVANTRGEFQQLDVAFKTMLGSEEKAATLMSQLVRTAAITPFDLQGVANGAKQLLAYGVSADEVNKRLTQLGDIASGLSIPLNDLVYLYGTTITQGKMFTQDLRQFQGRGIPIADELAKQFGVAKDKVGELVTAGKVGSKEFIAAIDAMTGEGSKFGGLMEEQSKTISGQISNIEDAFDTMLNDIGKSQQGLISGTLDVTSTLIENWQTVLGILGSITAAYGVQKAILALDAGFTKAATNYGYDAEIEQLKALIPLKEEEQKTALQQAVASGNLTEAKAAEVTALREEAQAQLEALTAKETAAKAEAASAAEKVNSINEEILGIQSLKESLLEQYTAATNAGDAEKAQALATDIASAETWLKEEASLAAAAAEEAKTAATNAAAASEARETLATQINTAQTTGNTAATGVLTIAKEKLAVAIGKVNAMLKANQFAIAAGAVIALGYAVYKLFTYQTDYQKSLEKVSKATQEATIAGDREIKTLDELKAKLDIAQKGSSEWKAAKDAIVKQFGQYIPQLDEEILKVGNLSTAYHDLVKAIQQANAAKGLKKFIDENDNSEEVTTKFRESLDKFKKSTKISKTGKAMLEPILRDFAINSAADSDIFKYVEDQLKIKYGVDRGKYVYDTYEYLLKRSDLKGFTEAHKMNQSYEREIEKYRKDMGISESDYNKVRYGIETPEEKTEIQDKSYWETKKKEAEARLEALDSIAAKGKEGAKIKEEIKQYEKEIEEAYSTKDKKSTGPTAAQIESKETEAHQKLLDLMKQQAEERLKLQQDYEYQQWQNRIDLMEEGEAKVLAQMRLDQEKERASLEDQKKQAIQAEIARQKAVFDARQDEIAAGNKKYAKQVFDPDTDIDQAQIKIITDRYDALNSDLLTKQQKANADRLQAAKDAMNAYLKEFGSYEEKRAAIAEEYNRKISEAGTLGDKLQLQGEKRKALGEADFEQFKKSGSMSLAFGDVSGLTKETIRGLISELEKYREKATETFDPEKIKEYNEALSGLREAEIEGSFGMLGDMVPEYFKRRIALQEELNDKEAEALITEQKQKDLQKQINDQRAKVATLAVIAPDSKEYKKAVNELTRMEAEEDAAASQSERLNNEIKVLAERIKGLDGEEKFKAIAEAVGNVAGLVGDLANQASEMADAMGAEGLGKALGYLGEAMGSVQNVASGFAQGGLVGGIAAAAGEAMKWVTKLFQAGDARHQRNIERLQDQIDALGKSYEKVGKAADKAYSTDASKLIDQQNTLLKQQQALIRQQIAEEEAKKKTDKDKIKEWKEQLDEINETLGENAEKAKEAIVGKDIKSAIDEFASLYAGAWDDGTDAAQKSMQAVKSIISGALTELLKKNIQPAAQNFYDTLSKAMEDGILTDAELANLDTIKAQMDALAASGEEQYKKIQERYKDLDELREELTDISFDSVRDNFKSLLSDMESSTEDFTESFTDMLRNALINGLMDNKYDALLKEWYNDFAEAMNDQTLTDSERDALRQQYDAIVHQGIADRNAINAIVGGGAYSQQASSGSTWNMSQETGEELNGRFTAMVELEATNNVLVSDGNAIAREILVTLRSMSGLSMTVTGNGDNETLLAIKDMMFLSTGYLEDIAKYSKLLADISSDVSEMKSAVKDL